MFLLDDTIVESERLGLLWDHPMKYTVAGNLPPKLLWYNEDCRLESVQEHSCPPPPPPTSFVPCIDQLLREGWKIPTYNMCLNFHQVASFWLFGRKLSVQQETREPVVSACAIFFAYFFACIMSTSYCYNS